MTEPLAFNRFMDVFADTRKQASVDAVFGTPIESEGQIVIPIASTLYGFGLGMGAGDPQAPAADDTQAGNRGAGGGGGYRTRPMAMAVIDSSGVRIQAIKNEERIAIAGIVMVAWIGFWGGRVL